MPLLVVSIDYAEDTEAPSHTSQEGELYFQSPQKLSLASVVDEGANEVAMFLLPEKKKLRKCGSEVASLLMQFLKLRNCTL